jgi:hypothetical protein
MLVICQSYAGKITWHFHFFVIRIDDKSSVFSDASNKKPGFKQNIITEEELMPRIPR